jgi:membrane protease YdiL (CAAX protease family)
MSDNPDRHIQEALAALQSGRGDRACYLLEWVVQAHPDSELAWYWLAQAVGTAEERRFCLERVLALNRRNALARRELEALGPGPSMSPLAEGEPGSNAPGTSKLPAFSFHVFTPHVSALAYLVLLAVAEILTAMVEPRAGLILHGLLLTGALLQSARWWDHPTHRFWLGVSLAPLIRLLSLSLPLRSLPMLSWYFVVSVPLFGAVLTLQRVLRIPWDQMGVRGRGLPLQMLIGLLGPPLGILEYRILRPTPLISGLNEGEFLLAALILMVCTGLIEELIFRGVMQQAALETMGVKGLVYVSAVFAVLHIGYRSLADVLFVFGVALLFGWLAWRTRSIVGVSLTHGLINIWLFLVAPFL